jgi:hypothetical protein
MRLAARTCHDRFTRRELSASSIVRASRPFAILVPPSPACCSTRQTSAVACRTTTRSSLRSADRHRARVFAGKAASLSRPPWERVRSMIFSRSSPLRDRHDGQAVEDCASRHGWYQVVCGPRKTISAPAARQFFRGASGFPFCLERCRKSGVFSAIYARPPEDWLPSCPLRNRSRKTHLPQWETAFAPLCRSGCRP